MDMKSFEFEAKGLIDSRQFDYLLSNLPVVKHKVQVNNYLDTSEGFFKNQSSALRLRKIDDEYIFSLKMAEYDGAVEYNQHITQSQYINILQSKVIDLSLFDCPFTNNLTDLQLVTLTTDRFVCTYKDCDVELDKTNFGHMFDYEIEIESTSMSRASHYLQQVAQEFDLSIKKSYPKIARYYSYL